MWEPPTEPDSGNGSGDLIGTSVGRYRVLAQIGRGGQGEVFLAEDPKLLRKVALKKLPSELSRDRRARRRAVEEAVRASRMSDPHLAEIFDIVENDGDVTLVMEYVEGELLRERIRRGISLEEFWDIAFQCVEALEAAHRSGLLHRDIKPENIMITPKGQVKILDFGLAKRLPRPEELASMTTQSYTPGAVSGTPPYMSPEAHLNGDLDERSDLFSLGVVFYEMLTGCRPFRGNLAEIIDGILRGRPEPPSTVRAGVPAALDQVILKLLARDRAHRYVSASDLLKDMAAAHRGELALDTPTVLLPGPSAEPAPGPVITRRRIGIAAGAFLVLVVAGFAFPGVRFHAKRALGINVLPQRVSAAVLPYEISGTSADLSAFGLGLGEVVNERLNRLGAAQEVYVAPSGDTRRYAVSTPEAARAELGVTTALRTRLHLSGAEVMGRVELLDVRQGRTLAGEEIREPWADPEGLVKQLTLSSARLMGLRVNEPDTPVADHLHPEIEAGVYRFYLEGLGFLAQGTDSAAVAAATQSFDRAVSIIPEFAEAWGGLARAHYAMSRIRQDPEWLEKALQAADHALEQDPDLTPALYVRGCVQAARQQGEQAAKTFETVIHFDPACRDAYYELADVYEQLGLPVKAANTYQAVTAALPLDYHCYWKLGYFHFGRGEDEQGLDAFHRMTEAAPDLFRGYAYYGGLLVQMGRYREAVDVLKRSIALKPIDSAYTNLGTAQFQLRNFDQAIRTYREAISLGYENHRMWYNLGDAYYWAPGKRDLARNCYLRAIDLVRNDEDRDLFSRCEVADMLPKVGRGEEAQARMNDCLAEDGGNPRVLYWAALVAWQVGDQSTALDRLEKAVDAGYSVHWLRDSPVFDAWRGEERFLKLLERDASA